MFDQRQLAKLVDDERTVRRAGYEGRVYLLGPTALKIQRKNLDPSSDFSVYLAERRRRSVHAFFENLLREKNLTFDFAPNHWGGALLPQRANFVQVSQASRSNGSAVGVLPALPGRPVGRPQRQLYDAVRDLGAVIDMRGTKNVIHHKSELGSEYTIIETFAGIHLEGLVQLNALRQLRGERYHAALYHFAWAMQLNGVCAYPTCPFEFIRRKSIFDYVSDPRTFWMSMSGFDGDTPSNSIQCRELDRARRIFGRQFKPQALLLPHFENYANFGLSEGLVVDIQEKMSTIRAAAHRVKYSA